MHVKHPWIHGWIQTNGMETGHNGMEDAVQSEIQISNVNHDVIKRIQPTTIEKKNRGKKRSKEAKKPRVHSGTTSLLH